MWWTTLGILGITCGLAAPASAQFVSREDVTTVSLADDADIVVLGSVEDVSVLEEGGRHEALLVSVLAESVVAGPEQPGEMLIFVYTNMAPSVEFRAGERPLLFLKALQKDDLRCTGCEKSFGDVHDLRDGNYYAVLGARWGKITPGDAAAERLLETLRLRREGDAGALKDHLLRGTDADDARTATDAVIDLLHAEEARAALSASDAGLLIQRLELHPERFRPVEPLVALLGHTGSQDAASTIVTLAAREEGVGAGVAATALRHLADAGVDVAATIRIQMDAPLPVGAKGRLLRVVAGLGDPSLTETVIDLTGDRDLRLKALLALGDLRDPRGVPVLLEALESTDRMVRRTAAVALAFSLGEGLKALIEWQESHPDDELAAYIDGLRRNPSKVREGLGQW